MLKGNQKAGERMEKSLCGGGVRKINLNLEKRVLNLSENNRKIENNWEQKERRQNCENEGENLNREKRQWKTVSKICV